MRRFELQPKYAKLAQTSYSDMFARCDASLLANLLNVMQRFTDVIIENHNAESLDEIRSVHELRGLLARYCPALLHSVVPPIEEELRVEDVPLRTLATQTLGGMFAEKGGSELAHTFPSAWASWLA